MKDRLIPVWACFMVAASYAFSALGIASITDSPYAKSWEMFTVVFIVTLVLALQAKQK